MRTLVIKFMAPKVECLLSNLLAQAFQLSADIAMQPLMGSVILGMAGTTSF
jgi:hypothetical protein